MLKLGDTFLIPSREDGKPHLWIVLTQPDEEGKAVCVNVSSSWSSLSDKTVILKGGDHPFISRKSAVRYMDADLLSVRAVDEGLRLALDITCVEREPCTPELLSKAQKGLLKSPHTPNRIKEKMRAYLNSERSKVN